MEKKTSRPASVPGGRSFARWGCGPVRPTIMRVVECVRVCVGCVCVWVVCACVYTQCYENVSQRNTTSHVLTNAKDRMMKKSM